MVARNAPWTAVKGRQRRSGRVHSRAGQQYGLPVIACGAGTESRAEGALRLDC